MPLSSDPSQGVLPACPGHWLLVLCLVTMGPAPANSEANRDRAGPRLPGIADSITHCSVSAEKASTVTCILEPSPHRLVRALRPLALPTRPSTLSARQQRSRNSEVQPRWPSVTSWEVFWVGSPCLHLLPGLAEADASKPLPAPKIPALPPGPARKCLAH